MAKRGRLFGAKRFLCCGFVFLSAMWAGAFGTQSAYAEDLATIDEGVYEIRAQVSDKALDIAGGSAVSGTNVQTFTANSTAAQYWRIERSGDHYVIVNSLTGVALDVAAAGMVSGTNVQVRDADGALAQQWDFVSNGNGAYEIRSALNGLVLDVSGAGTYDGANVQVYEANDTVAQSWSLIEVGPALSTGIYTISSACDVNSVLDVSGGSLLNGGKIQIWASNGTAAQKWGVVYSAETGFYTILSAQSGKALDIPGGNAASGVGMQQYTSNGTVAQSWRISANGDGSYTIYSAINNQVLDLAGGNTADGTRVQLWDSNQTDAQRWSFTTTDVVAEGLYQIESSLDDQRVLDISGGSLDAYAYLQVWSKNDTLAQKWLVESLGENCYSVKNANSGLYLADDGNRLFCSESNANASAQWSASVGSTGGVVFTNVATDKALDLSGANTAIGSGVSTYSPNGTGAQTWRFVEVDLINDGYYVITNRAASDFALDVDSASTESGARVQLWSSNGTDAQIWYVENTDDGWCTLTNANSGLALDVPGASTASGTALQQHALNSTDAQYWRFSVGTSGGVAVSSKLGNLALTTRGTQLQNGVDAIVATSQDNTSFGWLFSPTTFVSAVSSDIWNDPAYIEQMRQKANTVGSETDWFCTVDKSRDRTIIFKRSGNNWVAVKTTNVVTSGHTFEGTWEVTHKARGYWKEPDCYNVNDWWVCFVEAWSDDYNGHLRYDASAGAYDDGQGFHYGYSSGGCTAVPDYDTAKWIYDNVTVGSRVVVF